MQMGWCVMQIGEVCYADGVVCYADWGGVMQMGSCVMQMGSSKGLKKGGRKSGLQWGEGVFSRAVTYIFRVILENLFHKLLRSV